MPNFGINKRMPAGGEADLRSAKQQDSTKKLKTKRLVVPILPVPDVSQKKTVTTQKSVRTLVTPPSEVSSEEGQARLAYSILMRLLECGKGGEKGLSATIKSEEIVAMLDFAKPVFMSQPSCVEIDGPISICGDVHGQFSDLLRLFDKAGFPTRTNYLFLGDYVDRGRQSLETILMLLAYKLIFPVNFFLLRGNHECPTINKVYGFYDECTRRLGRAGIKVWTAFQDTFATMPLTALVGEKILCMHGGLSPRLKSLDQLRQFRRPNYQPDHASMEIDILWSDPSNFTKGWSSNQRGVSYVFGPSVVHKLLDSLNIDLVVRAHQVVQDGYEFFAQRRLVTIFSAPFYCGQFDNAAAVMIVTEELVCSFQILRPRKFLPKRRLGAPKKASKVLVF